MKLYNEVALQFRKYWAINTKVLFGGTLGLFDNKQV